MWREALRIKFPDDTRKTLWRSVGKSPMKETVTIWRHRPTNSSFTPDATCRISSVLGVVRAGLLTRSTLTQSGPDFVDEVWLSSVQKTQVVQNKRVNVSTLSSGPAHGFGGWILVDSWMCVFLICHSQVHNKSFLLAISAKNILNPIDRGEKINRFHFWNFENS